MALYLWSWLQTRLMSAAELVEREEGQDGLEYAVVAAVVIVAVAVAYTQFSIGSVVTSALTAVKNQVPGA